MVGDPEVAMLRADAELDALGIPANAAGTAVDLGAGFGAHALPLARRGYRVIAIDSCEPLLRELEARRGTLQIRTVAADLSDFRSIVKDPVNVILCLGDTLTHLPDVAAVESLFGTVAEALVRGGTFMTTFRDYVSEPLQAAGRFILVRSDDDRIMTCFLEYADKVVNVHDVLHERASGTWHMRVSSYPKLRLSPEWVVETLRTRGFSVRREIGLGGMIRFVARL
jgi:predicted RNA methylase